MKILSRLFGVNPRKSDDEFVHQQNPTVTETGSDENVEFHKTHESCRFRRSICGQLEDHSIILEDLSDRLTALERRVLANGSETVHSDTSE